jgi:hypothetical protein
MAREYKYVDLGFDSFDRAYEPEVITYCCDGAVSTSLSAAANTIDTISIGGNSYKVQAANNYYDSVATVSAVDTVSDQVSKLTQALQELADASGMYLDTNFNLKKKNEGVMKSRFSHHLELGGGIQKLKKSALLTI